MEGHTKEGSLCPPMEPHGALYLRIGSPAGGKKKEWYQTLAPGPDFVLAVRMAVSQQANGDTSLCSVVRGPGYINGMWLAYCGHWEWL